MPRLPKIRLKKGIRIVLSAVLLLCIIGFTENQQGSRLVPDMKISIFPKYESHFVHKEDIRNIVTHNGRQKLVGEYVDKINVKALEVAIKRDKFVESAQVYRDLKGNLIIRVSQRKPIARVLQNDTSFYLGSKGNCLPPSNRFSARVPMITGHVVSNYFSGDDINSEQSALFELVRAIDKDKFLKKLISQLHVKKDGEIDLYMQMSKQVVSMGMPTDIDAKLDRVKIFYKKILLNKGYNYYSNVNVGYKNQIVCE